MTRRPAKVLLAAAIALLPRLLWAEGSETTSCVTCHGDAGGDLGRPVDEWKRSIHARVGVGCADCHGGNPRASEATDAMSPAAGFVARPSARAVPELCARCHADPARMRPYNLRTDQLSEYKTSVHGKLLFGKGDARVAVCTSCHGVHEIRPPDDPLSSVNHLKVPETCGTCHADPAHMKPYGIPTDQLAKYREAYHGQILYGKVAGKNPMLVPNCATCHGTHGATPPGVREVRSVCGTCHTAVAEAFDRGPHGTSARTVGEPLCITCHDNHRNVLPTLAIFTGDEPGHCGSCHGSGPGAEAARRIREAAAGSREALRGADASLREVEAWGKNLDAQFLLLEEARREWLKIAPASHALDPAAVDKLHDGVIARTSRVATAVDEIRDEVRMRKRSWGVTAGFLGVFAGLLLWKLRRLFAADEARARRG